MGLAWLRVPVALIWVLGLCVLFLAAPAGAQAGSPLSIDFSATPNPASPGDAVVYKIALANPSATTPTAAFSLRVNVPQYFTATYVPNGQCNSSCRFGGFLSYAVPAIPPGGSTLLQFTGTIDNSTANPAPADGTVLTAQLSATLGSSTLTASTDVVVGAHRMHLAVSGAPSRVAPGALLTYTLSFGNAGSSAAAAILSVPLPAGTTFVSATGTGAVSAGAVEWDLGSLAVGFSDRRQFTVKVADNAAPGTFLVARAALLASGNRQALVRESVVDLVASDALLSVSVVASPDPVAPGSTVLVRVRIANRSTNTPTAAFYVWSDIPRYTTVTYVPNGQCNSSCRFGGLLSWHVASLDPGDSTNLQFTMVVDNSTANPPPPNGTVLTHDVTAFVFGGVSVRESLLVADGSRLNLSASSTPDRVAPGDTLTYALNFGNSGSGPVSARLRLPVPPGTSFVSATGGGAASAGVVEWNLGALAAGFADRRLVTVKVDDSATPGTLLEAQPELVNASSRQSLVRETVTSLVASDALLSMSLIATPDPAAPGDTVVYSMRVANRSTNTPTAAFYVWVNLPRFLTVTYVPNGQCNSSCRFGGLLSYQVPSLAPGESTLLQFTAVVDNSTANPPPPNGTLLAAEATAFVFGGMSTRETSFVGGGSRLNLALSGSPDRVEQGSTLTYTVRFGNAGTSEVPAVLRVPVPAFASFVSASGDGALSSGAVSWDLGAIAAGVNDQREFTVKADNGADDGTLLVARAEILDPASGRTMVRDGAANLIESQTLLSLQMSATPEPAKAGGNLVFSIPIANGSSNTPTGAFYVWANVPRFTTVTSVPGGQCNSSCRFGGLLSWHVPSLDPGGNTILQFTAAVDNSVANPPPPTGTLLRSDATAFVFGGVRANSDIRTGSPPVPGTGGMTGTGGGGSNGGQSNGGAGGADSGVAGADSTGEAGEGGVGSGTAGGPGTGSDAGAGGDGETAGAGGDASPGGGSSGGRSGSGGSANPMGGTLASGGTSSGGGGMGAEAGSGGSKPKSPSCSCELGRERQFDSALPSLAFLALAWVGARRRRQRAA
jgi:uncharacterized repeat protein (TIGR01451 family)